MEVIFSITSSKYIMFLHVILKFELIVFIDDYTLPYVGSIIC
jgi:hypothetical protein